MEALLDTSKPLDVNLLTQVVHLGHSAASAADAAQVGGFHRLLPHVRSQSDSLLPRSVLLRKACSPH